MASVRIWTSTLRATRRAKTDHQYATCAQGPPSDIQIHASDAPAAEGHIVVVPKEHVPSIHALPMAAQKGVWALVSDVQDRLRSGLVPGGGFAIGFMDGLTAVDPLPHTVIHVVFRAARVIWSCCRSAASGSTMMACWRDVALGLTRCGRRRNRWHPESQRQYRTGPVPAHRFLGP